MGNDNARTPAKGAPPPRCGGCDVALLMGMVGGQTGGDEANRHKGHTRHHHRKGKCRKRPHPRTSPRPAPQTYPLYPLPSVIPFAPSDDPVTVGPYTVALGIEPRSDGFAVALDVEYPNPGDSSGGKAFTTTRSEDSMFGMLADAPEVVAYVDEGVGLANVQNASVWGVG